MTLGHKSPWVRTTKGQFRKLAANRSEPVCVCVWGVSLAPSIYKPAGVLPTLSGWDKTQRDQEASSRHTALNPVRSLPLKNT